MVQLTFFPDNSPRPRWITPPWTTESEPWQKIDLKLPADHRARQIAQLIAGLDLTALVRSYAGLGSQAYPPELLLRLALFEMHRGCLSPAQWFRDCQHDDAVKWLLMGLQPSRSCLYQFRDRVGPYLDQWNRQILQAAQAQGWTPAKRASVDGTFASAYGSRHTLITAKTLANRCQQLEEAMAADFAAQGGKPGEPVPPAEVTPAPARDSFQAGGTPESDPPPGVGCCQAGATPEPMPPPASSPASKPTPTAGALLPATAAAAPHAAAWPCWMAKTPAGRFRQRQRYRRAQQQMTQRQHHLQQTLSRQAKAKRQSPERLKISPSEPETVLGLDKAKTFRPLYNIQLACDLDSNLVLGWGVFAAATDANLFGPLMARTQDLSGRRPEVVLSDPQYANIMNLKLCRDQKITMYAPVPDDSSSGPTTSSPGSLGPAPAPAGDNLPHRKKPPRLIPKAAFTWLPEQQTYRCPQGHLLVFRGRSTQQRTDGDLVEWQYRCPAQHCQACPLASRCTRSPQRGRIIKRSQHDDLNDALRERMRQPQSQTLYRLRKQTVERQFADLKQHRGLRRFASFGLERAQIQVGLLVLAHNGLELLKARRREPGKQAESREAA
jgi:transposase